MNTARWVATISIVGAVMLIAPVPAAADCPMSVIQIGGTPPSQVSGPSASSHVGPDGYGYGDAWFLEWGDSLGYNNTFGGFGGSGSMQVRGVFEVLGADRGTPVSLTLETRVSGDMSTLSSYDGCFSSGQVDKLLVAGVQVASHTWLTQGIGYPSPCADTIQEVYDVPVTVNAGEAFQIERNVGVSYGPSPYSGSARFRLSLWFRDPPPGTFVVACNGDTSARLLAVGGGTASGLAFGAVWPNPSGGEIHASCALPRGGPVVLRLFDAAGRVRETRIWDAPGATQREVTLGARLAPGAYFLQISQGATSATKTVTIVR